MELLSQRISLHLDFLQTTLHRDYYIKAPSVAHRRAHCPHTCQLAVILSLLFCAAYISQISCCDSASHCLLSCRYFCHISFILHYLLAISDNLIFLLTLLHSLASRKVLISGIPSHWNVPVRPGISSFDVKNIVIALCIFALFSPCLHTTVFCNCLWIDILSG